MKKSSVSSSLLEKHFACNDAVAVATTAYLACMEIVPEVTASQASEAVWQAGFIAARGGRIIGLGVGGGPAGAGETYTYTVRVNGAATALTCQIAGAAQASNGIVGSVVIAAGDRITVELVTSAAAAGSRHVATITLV